MKKNINNNYQATESAKAQQLDCFTVEHSNVLLTTNQGVGISNTDDSLKAGERGPTLLEDFFMREKITHFDHERIPERVVHARGFGAHGYFQVYKCMKKYTKAKFLQDPQIKTPVFVRFSTVVGSRGSADTVRDVRGFATKFFTDDGNYDLVANNIPVFFIQDAIKFPDVVHSIKPEPDNEIPQASAAHDTFWDFVINTPETAHMIVWLMSDRAIPRSFRMMEGFGVNTFKFINDEGKSFFVKFHWKPFLGVHSLVWDEAQKLAGKDPDFNRRDLWDAIVNGKYPEFELGVQILDPKDEFKFDFDILDPTKLWPEEMIPVEIIGKMTLNRNVNNFFAETEQVAFCPANIVPGIDFSNDPLLQGRLHSYLDTQLIRLGGPNFQEIPINRPIVSIHNNQRDGHNRMTIDKGKVSYLPNSLNNNNPHTAKDNESSFAHHQEKIDGIKIRKRSESFKDHYSQATLFWNSMSPIEKSHIIDAFKFEIGSVKDRFIQQQVVNMFNNVDNYLACEIAKGLGLVAPKNTAKNKVENRSSALSQENTTKTAFSRKAAILIENGFREKDVKGFITAIEKESMCYDIVSSMLGAIVSKEGIEVNAAKTYLTTASVMYDAVYVPGGKESIEKLSMQGCSVNFINEAFKHAKTIAASNEGVDFVKGSQAGFVKVSTVGSDEIVNDYGVITARNKQDLTSFYKETINAVAQHRHWGRCDFKGQVTA